jgi:hypothetical protein
MGWMTFRKIVLSVQILLNQDSKALFDSIEVALLAIFIQTCSPKLLLESECHYWSGS